MSKDFKMVNLKEKVAVFFFVMLILLNVNFSFAKSPQDYSSLYVETYILDFHSSLIPESVYIDGGLCFDGSCSRIVNTDYWFIDTADLSVCINKGTQGEQYSCVISHLKDKKKIFELKDNFFSSGSKDFYAISVVVPDVDKKFSFWSSPKGDKLIPKFSEIDLVSFDSNKNLYISNSLPVLRYGQLASATANIKSLDVVNVDSTHKLFQYNVSAVLDSSVCSAYQKALGVVNKWETVFPAGFSDISSDVKLTYKVKKVSNNYVLHTESFGASIEADVCGNYVSDFVWDGSDFKNVIVGENLEFSLQSEVVDNQVYSKGVDVERRYQIVHPQVLDSSAWVNLRNLQITDKVNTVNKIYAGADVFLMFDVFAAMNEAEDPIDYELEIFVDDKSVFSQVYNSGDDNSNKDFRSKQIEVTDSFESLDEGVYQVVVVATPQEDKLYKNSTTVRKTVEVLDPKVESVVFEVSNSSGVLQGASVSISLKEVYNINLESEVIGDFELNGSTNSLGRVSFEDLYPGEYSYEVSMDGYLSSVGVFKTGLDVKRVVLQRENQAPVVDLGDYYSASVGEKIVIDLDESEVVRDFDNEFYELNVEFLQENLSFMSLGVDGKILTLKANESGKGYFCVNATDPDGLYDFDCAVVEFVENQAPSAIFSYYPTKDVIVGNPVTFRIDGLKDVDTSLDSLICFVNFDDGDRIVDSCVNLSSFSHSYLSSNTFKPELSVYDGFNNVSVISSSGYVSVRKPNGKPKVDVFELVSSSAGKENGTFIVPTDLKFFWNVVDDDENDSLDCSFFVDGSLVKVFKDCRGNNSYSLSNFEKRGSVEFRLEVVDGSLSDIESLDVIFENDNVPPVFNLSSINASLGEVVELDLSSYVVDEDSGDFDYDFYNCNFEFKEFNKDTGYVRFNAFDYEGVMRCVVTVSDKLNSPVEGAFVVNVRNKPARIVSFMSNVSYGRVPFGVEFFGEVDGEDQSLYDLTCRIDYGDGVVDSVACYDVNAIHEYVDEGNYTAVLSVYDGKNRVTKELFIGANYVNDAPELVDVHNLNGTVGVLLNDSFVAVDPNNDSFRFEDNCEIFDIGVDGDIEFVPRVEDMGVSEVCTIVVVDEMGSFDSEDITIFIQNVTPSVNFTSNVSSGGAPLAVEFNASVVDDQNVSNLSCEIDYGAGDGFDSLSCVNVSRSYVYSVEGNYTAVLNVHDGRNLVSSRINITVGVANLPPSFVYLPNITAIPGVEVDRLILAEDPEGDVLEFGDDCLLFDVTSVDESTGRIRFVPLVSDMGFNETCQITINDSYNDLVVQNITVFVVDEGALPVANMSESSFVGLQNEDILLDATSSYDPNGYGLSSYSVFFNGKVYTSFDGNFVVSENVTGEYDAVLRVVNENGIESLPFNFVIVVNSSLEFTNLVIPEENSKGEFDFYIETTNETLFERSVKIKPVFLYGETKNHLLDNSGYMDTKLVTKSEMNNVTRVEFHLDTKDFELVVPTNEVVKLRLILEDEFDVVKEVEAYTKFVSFEVEEIISSVSGSSQEIIGQMKSSLSNMNSGFNDVDFKLVNYESEPQEVSLTMMSNTLDLNYEREFKLNPGEKREVNVPLYINENVREGSHFLRLSVRNGNQKRTDYALIRVSK